MRRTCLLAVAAAAGAIAPGTNATAGVIAAVTNTSGAEHGAEHVFELTDDGTVLHSFNGSRNFVVQDHGAKAAEDHDDAEELMLELQKMSR